MAAAFGNLIGEESDDSEEDSGLNNFVQNVIKKSATEIQRDAPISHSEERILSRIGYGHEKSPDGATCSKYLAPEGDSRFYSSSTPTLGKCLKVNDTKGRNVKGKDSSAGASQKSRGISSRPTSASESLLYHRNHSEKLVLETFWGAKQFQSRDREDRQPKVKTDTKDLHQRIEFYRHVSREDINMIGEDEEGEVKEKFDVCSEGSNRIQEKETKRERIRSSLSIGFRNSVHAFTRIFQPCCKKRSK